MAKLIFLGDRVTIHKTSIFKIYDGFAINNKDMEEIKKKAKEILIIYVKPDKTEEAYLVSVDNWLQKSITYDNRGELQTVLRRSFFDKVIK